MNNNKSLKKMNKKIKHTKINSKTRKSKKKRNSRKKTKKLSRRTMKQKNRKQKSKVKQTTLINGGGCGCSASGTTSTFKNYMSELRNSLDINNLGGGGYSVLPSDTINGHKTTIKQYDDNKPPIIKSVFN